MSKKKNVKQEQAKAPVEEIKATPEQKKPKKPIMREGYYYKV